MFWVWFADIARIVRFGFVFKFGCYCWERFWVGGGCLVVLGTRLVVCGVIRSSCVRLIWRVGGRLCLGLLVWSGYMSLFGFGCCGLLAGRVFRSGL